MPKDYVIPIDVDNNMYFGVKALINPYNHRANWWCAGAPNIFGGNREDNNIVYTLQTEAQQESHNKIMIDNINYDSLQPVHRCRDLKNNDYNYYALRNNFQYDSNVQLSQSLKNNPKYRECTGDIFIICSNNLDTVNRSSTANELVAIFMQQHYIFMQQHYNRSNNRGLEEFKASETVEAIRIAASRVAAGGL